MNEETVKMLIDETTTVTKASLRRSLLAMRVETRMFVFRSLLEIQKENFPEEKEKIDGITEDVKSMIEDDIDRSLSWLMQAINHGWNVGKNPTAIETLIMRPEHERDPLVE